MRNLKTILIVCLAGLFLTRCTSIPKFMSKEEFKNLDDGLYANMETSKGDMLIKLYEQEAPMTVANFIGLAEGVKENKAKKKGVPYYDGLIFHRVIKDFMIQGGDPQGTGVGGPGYDFEDEVDNDLKHDKKGVLSMANAGPNTNGSQFFITEVPTPWLDGRHTIFGQVVKGLDVIDTIANVEKNAQDKPKEDIKINKVEIVRKGDAYKKYDANKAFEKAKADHQAKLEEAKRKREEEMKKEVQRIKDLSAKAESTPSGLKYVVLEEGTGEKPKKGDNIDVHYTLRLADGRKLDSSYDRNQPLNIDVGLTGLIQGWMEALTMFNRGSKVFLIIPPQLGYGSQGAGGVVPPNATLFFDMEVLDK
ncbi:peptidylprolyl isomerase [Ornithobacterium rhinotracheale H06-030791]|uniref:peptidylprolyl isomerase n=2 Tax=Ornithobacterium rhinotracheale TaxID=28251 RepID=I3ZXN1_ORNRL|nr:peptidyl-prolyl cis-trans isomerase (rotamase) - cyclophilin family [Ornithobacterium rhinotracheale DSM 15997]AIP98674.1 peptidylprolyl isomerase [Ornithobacterium rhinotracheale ORT-UMN 88]KGB67663.1 peptidylprolyl isomerase [Ornithobacterium rhinotracheale H06-030791]